MLMKLDTSRSSKVSSGVAEESILGMLHSVVEYVFCDVLKDFSASSSGSGPNRERGMTRLPTLDPEPA